jgi:hypothetical protein
MSKSTDNREWLMRAVEGREMTEAEVDAVARLLLQLSLQIHYEGSEKQRPRGDSVEHEVDDSRSCLEALS